MEEEVSDEQSQGQVTRTSTGAAEKEGLQRTWESVHLERAASKVRPAAVPPPGRMSL